MLRARAGALSTASRKLWHHASGLLWRVGSVGTTRSVSDPLDAWTAFCSARGTFRPAATILADNACVALAAYAFLLAREPSA
eukprot:scaffold2364_cov426-Prasinococcus_capsulatus_cf.AAC.7